MRIEEAGRDRDANPFMSELEEHRSTIAVATPRNGASQPVYETGDANSGASRPNPWRQTHPSARSRALQVIRDRRTVQLAERVPAHDPQPGRSNPRREKQARDHDRRAHILVIHNEG